MFIPHILSRRCLSGLTVWLTAAVVLLVCPLVIAGGHTWMQDKVSAAINYAGSPVTTAYAPSPRPSGMYQPGNSASGGRITTVQASRDYHGHAQVQTQVCWGGVNRCVPMTGSSLNTQAFKGLDAAQPIYLVHTVLGKGALPAPLFIKGNVIVWYDR